MAFSVNNNTSNVTIQVTQPYLVVDDEGLKAFAVGIQGPPTGATTNLGGLTDVDDAAVPTNRYFVVGDGTKFVTRGILGDDLPTGIDAAKLANGSVSNTEFQYLGGVTSYIQTQIDGKAATSHVHSGADITSGTLPVARLNGGNSTQFVRGDGTYSNTLTGGLTIAGALAGATTGSFSTSVATPLLAPAVASAGINVSDNLNFTASQAIDGTKFAFGRTTGGNMFLNITAGLNFGIYVAGVAKANIGETSTLSGTGGLTFGGGSSTALSTTQVAIGSRIGGRLNLGAGTSVVQEIGGTAVTTVTSTGLAVTGAMAASGAVSGTTGSFSGTLTLSTACNLDFGANGTSSGTQNSITGQSSGLRINAKSGSSLQFVVGGVSKVSIFSTELSMGPIPINYGAAGTTTAANNETVGTSTGPRTNATSGSWVQNSVANVTVATFGQGIGNATNVCWAIGRYGVSARDYTSPGIASAGSNIEYNSPTQHVWYINSSANNSLRLGYALGTSNVGAWSIGQDGVSAAAWLASSGDGNMVSHVATSGYQEFRSNTFARRRMQHIGGVIIANLGTPLAIANTTTTTLMTATSRHGWLRIVDNTGQYAVIRISNTATPVIEASSANFAITASPSASQLGINLSSGTLSIVTGSAAGTTISVSFEGQ